MLKLQKASSDRQISIIIRDKEYFFTHSFLIAFALAAGFHLLFLLIFHIAPFKIRWSETLFPPVQVEASFNDAGVVIAVTPPLPIASGLPPARPSLPILPEQPTLLALRPMEYLKENDKPHNPFSHIERNVYQPVFAPLHKPPLPPITLMISGPLSGKSLLADGLQDKRLPRINYAGNPELRTIYHVLVEEHSGRIFWHEPKELTNIAALDRFAEGLLQAIVFAPGKQAFVTDGEVELHFNLRAP